MSEIISDAGRGVFGFLTNRIVWLLIVTVVLFSFLVAELFYLQVVISHTFTVPPPVVATMEQTIPAPRGNIYDRFGRPLTVNHSVHVVTMDPSVVISNEALLELSLLFERHGEDFVDEFPMTTEWPYEFTLGGNTPEIRQRREYRWKADMYIPEPETATAVESYMHLLEQFEIDADTPNEDARRILNFRCMIFERRFRSHEIFVIATDVSMATVAAIEEQNTFFTGVGIEMRTLREYPQGKYFTHMLGYTGVINAEELLIFPDYAHDDVIGKAGLERAMEEELRGRLGTQVVEINPATGRRIVGSLPEITPPSPGDNIFLTLDIDMQRQTYYILKGYLTEIVARRITTPDSREQRVHHNDIFINLIRAGWIPIRELFEACSEERPNASAMRQYILDRFPEATYFREDRARIVSLLIEGIESGRITPAMIFLTMVDLEILSDYNDFVARAQTRVAPNTLIVEKLRMGELTPQMLNVDPATGSVVVVCVPTGAVLAAVGYPSYDNNRLANRVEAEYFYRINQDDPTTPMVHRPFQEVRPPGSTFKMITAVAGLETGVINPRSTIRDNVVFTRAGIPHPRCWHSGGHGSINVAQAIAVSCNYFFYETSFRLGNTQRSRIDTLNQFMEFFGLNERSGVEIGEHADIFNRDRVPNIMSSPSFKEHVYRSRDEFSPRSQWDWFDGNTVATAIGQGYNNLSSAQMARYIAQIANNGQRFPLFLVDNIRNYRGEIVYQNVPMPDDTGMTMDPATWENIHLGMLWTTEGHGTAVRQFRGENFPISVGGKTGTAQQIANRPDHQSFGGFAPFDDPQIAVYVSLPFGTTRNMPASATQVARDVIYAFLMPEPSIERPSAVNAIMR